MAKVIDRKSLKSSTGGQSADSRSGRGTGMGGDGSSVGGSGQSMSARSGSKGVSGSKSVPIPKKKK